MKIKKGREAAVLPLAANRSKGVKIGGPDLPGYMVKPPYWHCCACQYVGAGAWDTRPSSFREDYHLSTNWEVAHDCIVLWKGSGRGL